MTNGPHVQEFELRPEPRKRVLLAGLVVYGHGAFTCDCTFRNLSSNGGKLVLPYPLALPSRFNLINIREGIAYEAHTVWAKDVTLGVEFDAVISLSETNSLHTQRLRRLWLAKVAHQALAIRMTER